MSGNRLSIADVLAQPPEDRKEFVERAELGFINHWFEKEVCNALLVGGSPCPFKPSKVEAWRIFGETVYWTAFEENNCDFCGGKGDLSVRGVNGKNANVSCPVCHGSGEGKAGQEWEFTTDIDGENPTV